MSIPKLRISDVAEEIKVALKRGDSAHLELYERYLIKIRAGEFQPLHKATWFRWVASIRGDRPERAAVTARKAAKHLPAAPPPAYINQYPGRSVRSLDILGRLDELYEDAKKLRDYALTEEGKVKSPKFLGESIKIRRDLLESALEAVKEVYNLERMEDFYRIILEEISDESSELGGRIIDRLRRANEKHMMTPDCDPRARDHNKPAEAHMPEMREPAPPAEPESPPRPAPDPLDDDEAMF